MSPEDRIAQALEYAVHFGGIDGEHHKTWVIDQMVRALTGCPQEIRSAVSPDGNSYQYGAQGESEEYRAFVADACAGEDGPETYSWEVGIAP